MNFIQVSICFLLFLGLELGLGQGRSSPASLQYAADIGLATDW